MRKQLHVQFGHGTHFNIINIDNMKIKVILISFGLIFAASILNGQAEMEELLRRGTHLHDEGDFSGAIHFYEKALKIDPNSALVNYEMSLSYFADGKYKEAIKYADVVLKENTEFLIQAYVAKGSALDMLGKTKESIKLFKKAIKSTEDHYLLNYNLALNHFKLSDFGNAEDRAISAIELNPNHSSSHLLLAKLHDEESNRIQSLLSNFYFLFLEPNSSRAKDALQMLHFNMEKGVSKNDNDDNNIIINLEENASDRFSAAQLMLSMMQASNLSEENDQSEYDAFQDNTKSFFGVLGSLNEDEHKDIWGLFYIPFFYELSESPHFETFCRYITQAENKASFQWLKDNEEKLDDFDIWLQNN